MPCFKPATIMMALCLLSMSQASWSGDLGTIGPVYEIREENLIEYMQRRIQAMQQSGELDRKRAKFLATVQERAKSPEPVKGLVRTREEKTFFIDPGIKTSEDIVGNNGQVIYPAGTYRNPLDVISLRQKLVFFDSNDKQQLEYVKKLYDAEPAKPRLILVSGKPFELMERMKIRVYFDQGGALVRKFGISQVPAIVSQEGRMLKVNEVKVN